MIGIEYPQDGGQGSTRLISAQLTREVNAAQTLLQLSRSGSETTNNRATPSSIPTIVLPTDYNGFATRKEELAYMSTRQVGWNPYTITVLSILWLGHKIRDARKLPDFEQISKRNRALTRYQYLP